MLLLGRVTQDELDLIMNKFHDLDMDGNGVLNASDLRINRRHFVSFNAGHDGPVLVDVVSSSAEQLTGSVDV